MKKILLSAFACEPYKGSEEGNGWNWAYRLAEKGYEVHCLTWLKNRGPIENHPPVKNLNFHYIAMPFGIDFFQWKPQASIYAYYMLWQLLAYRQGKKLQKKMNFSVVHHVSWGSFQMGSFLFKLPVPFIYGPAGGGQHAPENFRKYFLNHWGAEINRTKVGNWLVKYNPACGRMVKTARAVLVSNPDTLNLADSIGAANCQFALDNALSEDFFPAEFKMKAPEKDMLKLLWVGRFMARKGLLMNLEVMEKLKHLKGITLTIVGYGEMEDDIAAKIKQCSLQDTVTMVGRVPFEEVRKFYSSHDVFFFTSLRDSGSAQLLEALAFGMPAITLNLHGQALLVDDDRGIRCSAITPDETVEELRNAIIELYSDPGKVSKMSIEAYNFAKKQTWSAKIDHIVDNYYPN